MRLYIAGHRGLVGQALLRHARALGASNLILRTHSEADLTSTEHVQRLFREERPDVVIIAAAKVGGIAANMADPVSFLVDNLKMQNNVLEACQEFGVRKTVFLGSSCIYPRAAQQPIREDAFMHGPLEPTNESYAVAKIAGVRLAQALHEQHGLDVICPMPTNIYGLGDHYGLDRAHVLSALVHRFCVAADEGLNLVTLWGTGTARREFLFADDLADATFFLLDHMTSPELINVGTGEDISIRELAELIAEMVGYRGAIEWDHLRPDGMPRKLLDVSKIHALGWHHRTSLREGIAAVIEDFRTTMRQRSASGVARP